MLNKQDLKYKQFIKIEKKLNTLLSKSFKEKQTLKVKAEIQTLLREYRSDKYFAFKVNYDKSYPKNKERSAIRDKIRKFINGQNDDILFGRKVPLEYYY